MAELPISAAQLKRLQTLWGIHWAVVGAPLGAPQGAASSAPTNTDASRLARLGWIAGVIGRQLESAKDLTRGEAITVLDALAKLVPAHLLTKRRRPDRRTAKSYGTAGRKGTKPEKTIDLIDAPTWKLLKDLVAKRGWSSEQLDAFVRSRHGPGRLVTLADANKVIWALKQMMRRKTKSVAQALLPAHKDEQPRVAALQDPAPLEEVAAK